MSDIENTGFRGQGRPQNLDLLNLDQGVFPNEAFETSVVDGNEEPILTLKDPWALTGFLKDNRIPFKSVTDDLTIDKEDYSVYYAVTLTTVNKTLTLPSPADYAGRLLEIILVSTTSAKLSFSYSGNFLWKGYSNIDPTLYESGELLRFFSDGTDWIVLKFEFDRYFYCIDKKTTGTTGGSSSAGWNIRTLTFDVNTPLWGASRSGNIITLPKALFYIKASAPSFRGDRVLLKLVNITDTLDVLSGTSSYSGPTIDTGTVSRITQRLLTPGIKTYRLEHLIYIAVAIYGLGIEAGKSYTVPHETYTKFYAKELVPLI